MIHCCQTLFFGCCGKRSRSELCFVVRDLSKVKTRRWWKWSQSKIMMLNECIAKRNNWTELDCCTVGSVLSSPGWLVSGLQRGASGWFHTGWQLCLDTCDGRSSRSLNTNARMRTRNVIKKKTKYLSVDRVSGAGPSHLRPCLTIPHKRLPQWSQKVGLM